MPARLLLFRSKICLLTLLLTAITCAPVSFAGFQEPLQLSATLVQAPVVVTDKEGKFVSDLSKSDFAVFEDGKKQDLTHFASVQQPFSAALVIDTSNSAADRLGAIQNSASSFVRQMRPDDRAMLISFDNEIRSLTEFTSNHAELERAIKSTESGFGKLLYEAVTLALEQLKGVEGRRAVIIFSDAVDMRSVDASIESTAKLADEVGAAVYVVQFETRWWIEAEARKRKAEEKKNSLISIDGRIPLPPDMGGPTIGFPGGSGPKIEIDTQGPSISIGDGTKSGRNDPITEALDKMYGEADAFSELITISTGGRVFKSGSAAGALEGFAAIAEELRNQYLLGYYPKDDQRDGKFHKIKVQIARKGAQVRTRAGYTRSR